MGTPEGGGKHLVMWKAARRTVIPGPHNGDLDWSLTKRILDQAEVSIEERDNA